MFSLGFFVIFISFFLLPFVLMTVLKGVLFPTRITGAKAVISQAFYCLFLFLLFFLYMFLYLRLCDWDMEFFCISVYFPFRSFPFSPLWSVPKPRRFFFIHGRSHRVLTLLSLLDLIQCPGLTVLEVP